MSFIMCFENYKTVVPRLVNQGLVFLLFVEAITKSSGILITKENSFKHNATKFLDSNIKVNYTDNSINIPTKPTPTLHSNQQTTSSSIINTVHNGLSELLNSSRNVPTEKSVLSTSPLSTSFILMNFTTVAPSGNHKQKVKHSYKILLYILIPVSAVLLSAAVYFVIRHIQKVQRKRRLERELTHQYSYPNSEAGDIDDDNRLFEVESIINSQFHAEANEQEEKNFIAEIPEVTLAVGEGPRLVVEEDAPLIDNEEASTSFNC